MSVVDVLIYYRLAEKMQSLFTIFASHIVVHAAQVLKDNNKQITGNIPIGFLQLFTALNQNMQFLILLFINADPYSLFNMHDKVSQKKKTTLTFAQGMISMGPVRKEEGKLTNYWCMSATVCTGASCMIQRALLPRRDSTPCYSHWLIR